MASNNNDVEPSHPFIVSLQMPTRHTMICASAHAIHSHVNGPLTTPQAYIATTSNATLPTTWLLDSGATHHVTYDMSNLSFIHPYVGTKVIVMGNGTGAPITHIGSRILLTSPSNSIHLLNVLCAPNMTRNIISVSQLCADNNLVIEFLPDSFIIKDNLTRAHLIKGPNRQGIYELPSFPSILAFSSVNEPTIWQ